MKRNLYEYRSEAPMFQIPPGDPDYCSREGILFSKDGTVLWRYPTEKEDREYRVPDHVEAIGSFAFSHCRLETLDLNRIRRAGRSAVNGCDNLIRLSLGTRLETIRETMIYSCHQLQSLEIPPSVRSIENFGIGRCANMRELTIPKTVEQLARLPFGYHMGMIVRFEATGAVLYVRDQFPGTGDPEDPVDLEQYDSLFYRMDQETRHLTAFLRLAYPVWLSDKWRYEYTRFLRWNLKALTDQLIKDNNVEWIRLLAEMEVICSTNIDAVIDDANRAGMPMITACLLQIKGQSATPVDDLFAL